MVVLFELDGEVVRLVWGKFSELLFVEHVLVLGIFVREHGGCGGGEGNSLV